MESVKQILNSEFFKLGKNPISKEKLELYSRIWWPIQPEFTLGLIKLLSLVSEKIQNSLDAGNLKSEQLWKDIFKWQAPAIVDEMGLGRDPYGLMHHDLFIDQVTKTTSLTREDLIKNKYKSKNNFELAKEIRFSFTDVLSGLCMMYVVESIAPELFKTQKEIFLAAGSEKNDLRHSILHEELEQDHADEAGEYLEFLNQIAGKDKINSFIEKYSKIWKGFLDDVYVEISE